MSVTPPRDLGILIHQLDPLPSSLEELPMIEGVSFLVFGARGAGRAGAAGVG